MDDASVTPSGTPRAALELEAVNQPTRADGAPVDAKPRDGSLEGQPVLPDSGSDGARTRIATFNELPPPEAALEPAQEAELGLKLGRASASLLGVSPGGPAGNGREIAIAVHAFDPAALGAFRDVARVTTNTASAASLDAIFDATTSCTFGTIAVEGAAHRKLEVEGAAHRKLEVEGASRRELEVEGASRRELEVKGSAHRTLEVEGAAHRKLEVEGAAHRTLEVEGASRRELEVKGSAHRTLEVEGASRTKATPEAMLEAMPAGTLGVDSRASTFLLGGEFCREPPRISDRVASLLKSTAVLNGQVRAHHHARKWHHPVPCQSSCSCPVILPLATPSA